MNPPSNRLLWRLAWGNVFLHGVGLVLALFGMRPGSPLVPLPERMAYLAGHPAGWIWGWGVWMICSLLLLGYVAALRGCLPERSLAADLALTLTAAGMGADLLCDVVQIRGLPLATASEPLFRSPIELQTPPTRNFDMLRDGRFIMSGRGDDSTYRPEIFITANL